MAKAKHRRRKQFIAPRILLTCLLVYGAAAVLTFASIRQSTVGVPSSAPNVPLDNMKMDLGNTIVPMAPRHTEPTNPMKPMAEVFHLPDTPRVTVTATSTPEKTATATAMTAPTTTTTTTTKKPAPPASPVPPAPVSSSFRARFFAAAQSYLGRGIPYVYGGKTLAGLDCSGFIWAVLKSLSPNQPYRDSGTLNSWTSNVSMSQALPGDLVFWSGHVAVYAGNGNVITQGGPGPGPILSKLWPGYSFGRIPL